MAKKSMIERNNKRKKLVRNYRARRDRLNAIIQSPETPMDEVFKAVLKRAALPRNSSRTRIRNRCGITGRPRGYYGRFELCRNMLRELGNQGLLPGVKKSSW